VNADQDPEAPTGIEARSKAAFDASVGELNANVRSRLTQARFAAVAEMERGKRSRWQRVLFPVGGAAAAAIIVAMLVVPGIGIHRVGQPGAALADEDMPILLDTDNMEMIENMEFYAWLDEETLDDGSAQPVVQPDEPARS